MMMRVKVIAKDSDYVCANYDYNGTDEYNGDNNNCCVVMMVESDDDDAGNEDSSDNCVRVMMIKMC